MEEKRTITLNENEMRAIVENSAQQVINEFGRNKQKSGFLNLLEQLYEMMRQSRNPYELGFDDRSKYAYNRLSSAVSEMLGKKAPNDMTLNVRLHESRSIKSQKLAQIIKKYGGINRNMYGYNEHKPYNRVVDIHNITDDDIIGVFPINTTTRQAYDIAKKNGLTYNPGDSIEWVRLQNDQSMALFCIQRGGNNPQSAYNQKVNAREKERRKPDGEKRHSSISTKGKCWNSLPEPVQDDYRRRDKKEYNNPVRSKPKHNR